MKLWLVCVNIAAKVISKITLPAAIKMRETATKSESFLSFVSHCLTLNVTLFSEAPFSGTLTENGDTQLIGWQWGNL